MKKPLLLVTLAVSVAFAAVDARRTIPEITMRDGRIFKNFTIVAFNTSSVLAKWDGGRGTVAYDQFPEEYRKELEPMRPKQENAAPRETPSPAQRLAPRTITGQVFVTTQGSGAYKYSDVNVLAYPMSFYETARTRGRNATPDNLALMSRTEKSLAMLKAWNAAMEISTGYVAMAKTDADGNFTMTIRGDAEVFLFVKATRQIGGGYDANIWVTPVTRKHMELSGSNSVY